MEIDARQPAGAVAHRDVRHERKYRILRENLIAAVE
jgi:hypothetical protein